MLYELHAIERACRRVGGGLKRLVLVDPVDLAEQPFFSTVPNVAELSFLPGKAAYAFEQDRFSAQLLGDTDISNDAGDFFTYQLNCTFRNVRLEVEFLRAKLLNRRVHVIATYQDDTQRFIPYMRFRAREDSGTKGRDRNGYTFTATSRMLTPAPMLGGTLTIIYPDGTTVTPPSELGVNTVAASTTSDTYIYNVPAGRWLIGVYVLSDEAQTVTLGLGAGLDDLGGAVSAEANSPIIFQCNNLRPGSTTPIYLGGLAGHNSIEIWLLG